MSNLKNYFMLKNIYWNSLNYMQINIEAKDFENAMIQYLYSLFYADEIIEHYDEILTHQEKLYIQGL